MVCRLCEHTEGPVGSPLAGAIFYRSTSVRAVHSLVHSSTPAVLIKEMSHSAQILHDLERGWCCRLSDPTAIGDVAHN